MKIRTIENIAEKDKVEILCVLLREISIEFGHMNSYQLSDDIEYINQYFNENIKVFDDINERIKKLDNETQWDISSLLKDIINNKKMKEIKLKDLNGDIVDLRTKWDLEGCDICKNKILTSDYKTIDINSEYHTQLVLICSKCNSYWEAGERYAEVITKEKALEKYKKIK